VASRRGQGTAPEGLLALGVGTALTLALKSPVWRGAGETVPADAGDPVLLSWILAWVGHAATTAPLDVFDTNAFWPLPRTLAFSDALVGYAPFGVVGEGPAAALTRYAVVYLFAYALAFAGLFVLARQLGVSRGAALVAGAAFAFSPFRLSQAGHLQIVSSGGIPLALAMLARGHGIGRPGPVRPGWALGGWLVAVWQLSLGFGLGLMFAYLLGALTVLVAAVAVVRRVRPPTRLLVADGVGVAAFVVAGALLALPYLQVVEDHPNSRRDVATVELYSPPAAALVTAPPSSVLYGEATRERRDAMAVPPEMALLPGVAVVGLAVLGLVGGGRRSGLVPGWSRRLRLGLAAAVVLLTLLALGTRAPFGGQLTYLLLLEHAPGWQGVRTPGRLVTLGYLALALLAAAGVDVVRRAARTRAASAAVAVALAAVVLAEGLDRLPQAAPRPPPSVDLAALPEPVLVLPSDEVGDYTVMWWSTAGFPDLVNGGSAFVPLSLAVLRAVATAFPDPVAVAALRDYGVATVVVDRRTVSGSAYDGVLARPVPAGVGVTSYADVVVYDLRRP
jgi:hypothetical protein